MFFQREQSIRLQSVQFVQLITGPWDGLLGLNFMILYVYGGSLMIFFLKKSDRLGIFKAWNKKQIHGFKLSPEAVLNWLHGTWFDLLILAIILGYGFCIWFFRKFTVEDGQLYVQDSFIFTRKRIMPVKNLSALTIEHALFLRPFHASYLYADTASGLLNSTDIKLLIRKKDEPLFLSALPRLRQGKRHHYERKVRLWKILLFSVIFSSSFSGALIYCDFLVSERKNRP